MKFCGLITKEENVPIPLTAVNYDVVVRSFASRITIEQTYTNLQTTDLECVYAFPINDQAGITGFAVNIDDRVIQSQFKKKEQAFQEYDQALERGDGAYLLDQVDQNEDTFILSVGRLSPQKECLVSISYVGTLESIKETKLRLVIPTALYPRFNLNWTGTKQQIAPPENYQSSFPCSCTLNTSIEVFNQVTAVTSPSHPISVRIEDENKVKVTFGAQQQQMDKDFILDIEVKTNAEYYVEIEEYAAGQYAAMFSYVPHLAQEEKKKNNSELIFVVDCSGSMEEEYRIEDAKMAMQLFLSRIPEGCYFNFFRFGSEFTSLFPESVAYNETTFNQAKKYAEKTQANMGGTEILQPLKNIYSSELKSGFSRQIFILTDGQVENTEEVISLVQSNASNSRVFSFGLGNSPIRSLINGIAMASNAKSEFIRHGEKLTDKIGRHLSRALQPSVTIASIIWEGVQNVQQVPSSLPPVFFGDRQLVFAFFEKDPIERQTTEVSLQIGSQIKHTRFNLNDAKKMDGDLFINKLAARALIKEIETSPFAVKRIIDLSLTFGIISKYVSLVAVEKRQNFNMGLIELGQIPIQKAFKLIPFGIDHGTFRLRSATSLTRNFEERDYIVGFRSLENLRSPLKYPFGGSLDDPNEAEQIAENCYSWMKNIVIRSQHGLLDHKKSSLNNPSLKVKNFFKKMILGNSRRSSLDRDLNSRSFGSLTELESHSFDEPDKAKQIFYSPSKKVIFIQSKRGPSDGKKLSLKIILALQNWNGCWSASGHLIKLIPELSVLLREMPRAREILGEDILTTLIVMTLIENRYKDQISTWKAIIEKASAFISQQLSESVREDLQKQIRTLLGF